MVSSLAAWVDSAPGATRATTHDDALMTMLLMTMLPMTLLLMTLLLMTMLLATTRAAAESADAPGIEIPVQAGFQRGVVSIKTSTYGAMLADRDGFLWIATTGLGALPRGVEFLAKPFESGRLLQKVREVLDTVDTVDA